MPSLLDHLAVDVDLDDLDLMLALALDGVDLRRLELLNRLALWQLDSDHARSQPANSDAAL